MKKFLFASLFAACAAMGLSSCMNGDYDATPNASNANPNPLANSNNGGSGGNGGGGGGGTISGNFNDPNYYSWTGTDPLSMKIDGTPYQAAGVLSSTVVSGFITCTMNGGGKSVTVNLPDNVSAGTILTLSSSSVATVSLSDGSTYYSASGTGGAIYIVEKDATHVKGKFVANVKVFSGSGSKNLTDGYFNFTF